jgi:hypothetical protein
MPTSEKKVNLELKGKPKRCKSCKQKEVELPSIEEVLTEEVITIEFDKEDIVKAYHEMVRIGGIREEYKPFVNDVYKQLFKEEFRFDNCLSCKNNQYHKLRNYVRFKLNVRI